MKRLAVIVLTLMATGAAPAAAAAPPEFLNASGKTPLNVTFTGQSATGKLQAEGNTITCSSSTSSGTITGALSVSKVLVTYSGCVKAVSCRTPGQATGKIVTELLAGKLGETTQASSKVGLLLAPETGTKFTELESTGRNPCVSAGDVLIKGSVIGEVLPVNEPTVQTTGRLIFEKAGEDTQKLTAFTGAGEDELLAYGGLRSAIEQSNELIFSEAIKVT